LVQKLLSEVALDSYLLAKFAGQSEGIPEGRAWERALYQRLWRPGLSHRQQAGLMTFYGRPSASGCSHELDAIGAGWNGTLILEGKAKAGGITKSDIAVFHLKIFDFYCGSLPGARSERWWPFLISATPVDTGLKKLCFQMGIMICDPTHLPLPVLLRAAGRPVADQFLPEPHLQELVRLGEPACAAVQTRWRFDDSGEIRFKIRDWSRDEFDDLLWLQEELSGAMLDLYDLHRPGYLERRAGLLRAELGTILEYAT
jgi:hypothetical protein